MGKGTRARKKRELENKPAMRARATAAGYSRTAVKVGVAMLLLWAIVLIMQIVTQATMHHNLNTGVYAKDSEEEVARLTAILPSGMISVTLITIGLLVFFVLICKKMPLSSLIGWGLALAGAALFAVFFLEIQSLFPYTERVVGGTTVGKGLDFTTMMIRYYSAALPLVLPIPALICECKAKKYREIAEVMESAVTESTLSLGETDD